jgi:hypothetical protein
MVNNAPIPEIKITPIASVKCKVKEPLVFLSKADVQALEIAKEYLPIGYKIVKDNDE